MKDERIAVSRKTKETDIDLVLVPVPGAEVKIAAGVPFFGHLLTSMAFHGGFGLEIRATGDLDVDPHHLVEDVGLVLGDAFHILLERRGGVARFGFMAIPMDDALSEAIVDVCDRPYLSYRADYPQSIVGGFDVSLLREFFLAFTNRARINLHLVCRYGENSHHMAESLFKAMGKALGQAYAPKGTKREGMSTKGSL